MDPMWRVKERAELCAESGLSRRGLVVPFISMATTGKPGWDGVRQESWLLHVPSEMPTSPRSGEAEWADGDSGEKLWLKKSVGESRFCLDVVSSEGSGLDEVT